MKEAEYIAQLEEGELTIDFEHIEEIIRCKDCEYKYLNEDYIPCCKYWHHSTLWLENGYCHKAKKRKNDNG